MARKKATSQQTASRSRKPSLLTIIIILVIGAGIYYYTGLDPLGIFPKPKPTPPTPTEIATPTLPAVVTPTEIAMPAATPADGRMPELPKGEGNTSNESFDKAKRLLLKLHIDAGQTTEFYCGSTFDAEGNMDHSRSGFKFRKNEKRANRLEWEHVVPSEGLGQAFTEWRDGDPPCGDRKGKAFKGRDCAEKASKEFRLMQADMYNLQPAIGEGHGDRSNYSYAMIDGEIREYGAGNMEIDDQKE